MIDLAGHSECQISVQERSQLVGLVAGRIQSVAPGVARISVAIVAEGKLSAEVLAAAVETPASLGIVKIAVAAA